MAHVISHSHGGFGILARFEALKTRFVEARALRADYVALFNELDGLSDRDLADIGIGRSDIADIVSKHVYGH